MTPLGTARHRPALHPCRVLAGARSWGESPAGVLQREGTHPGATTTTTTVSCMVSTETRGLLSRLGQCCPALLQPLSADTARGWVGCSLVWLLCWDSWCLEGFLTQLHSAQEGLPVCTGRAEVSSTAVGGGSRLVAADRSALGTNNKQP